MEELIATKTGTVAHVVSDAGISTATREMLLSAVEIAQEIDDKIPCHNCQQSGCTVCNGFGYYYV